MRVRTRSCSLFGLVAWVAAGACGGEEPLLTEDQSAVVGPLSDDFMDASTLAGWTIMNRELTTSIDIDRTLPGRLTMIPRPILHNAWYSDAQAPFAYKLVTGNFVAEISVRVASTAAPMDPAIAPHGPFNSAGFVIRDPASANRSPTSTYAAPMGHASWLMYNMGFQLNGFAREAKTTLPSGDGGSSYSTLYLNATPPGVYSGRLRVCRIGSTFRMFHMQADEREWIEEQRAATTQLFGNGAGRPTPGVADGLIRFVRTDLPPVLQVGVVANAWAPPYQTEAQFDYIHFGAVATAADCTRPIDTLL
jgi:hypothetical protein